MPRRGSKREAARFVDREQAWIAKERCRIDMERARREASSEATSCAHAITRELRERARRELPTRLRALASAHGLSVARISIRNQKWRWGSCSRSAHICLNWRLITMPDWVRDYVMLHELMHLKRMDHSPRFWTLVARAFPHYEEARRWLRAYAHGGAGC